MRRHRPARRTAGRLGTRRRPRRPRALRPHRGRGARPARGGREAAVGLLRALRQPGHRGPRAAGGPPAATAGALVLLDVKRGDIGSTSQAYADAYLDPSSPLAVDAITASPYLGFGSLTPMIDTARRHGARRLRARPDLQQGGPRGAGGPRRRRRRRRRRARPPARRSTTAPTRSATSAPSSAPPSTAATTLDFNGPILAPGYGAQGGTLDDLRRIFGRAAGHVLPSTSRELLGAGPGTGWPRPPTG